MDQPALLKGLTGQVTHAVADADTAVAVGSGSLPVLATPRLVGWLEAATCAAVEAALGPGSSTVGTRIAVEHLLASTVGSTVTSSATLSHVDGRLLRFEVVATDQRDRVVAHGNVTRVVVDEGRFMARAAARDATPC